MSISQLFILSRRGDSIIYRDFRRDIKKSNDIFFHNVNFVKEEEIAPPLFNIDGINFIYVKTDDLYIVISTLDNASPNYYLEILDNIIKVIKDHIGILNEETIRKNFVLIYEIINEMIDFGIPQLSTTEQVKQFVFTEPIVMLKGINTIKEMFNKKTKSNENTKKSIQITNDIKSKNEIYVDIFEKVTCLFNRSGALINSGVDGAIKMKSYLKNSPELKIVLCDDVLFGKGTSYTSGRMEIENCNFYQGVSTKELENLKTLYLIPPEGEFILMNYHISNDFAPPFRIFAIVEESDYKLEVKLKVQANFSNKIHGANILVKFNVPKETQSVYFDLPKNKQIEQKVDYIQNQHLCVWRIARMLGGSEFNLDTKITLQINKPSQCRKQLGPITMCFEIPNYNISKLQIKELKVMSNDKKYNAQRWVRIFTQANSYVARIA
jgi:AP-4 complex subunit mu-1